MRIAILGTGDGAKALAAALTRRGHPAEAVGDLDADRPTVLLAVVGADDLSEADVEPVASRIVDELPSEGISDRDSTRVAPGRFIRLERALERSTFRIAAAEREADDSRRRLEALRSRKSVRLALRVAEPFGPLIRWIRSLRARIRRRATAPSTPTIQRYRSRADLVAAMRASRSVDHPRHGPLVSIVVLTRNGEEHLRRLLPSLVATSYEDFEVIIIDNASSDGTRELLDDDWPFQVRVIRNDGNASFSFGNNQGADAAHGEFLLFLNNDVEPITDDWLGAMVSAAQGDPRPAAVGALLVYPDRGDPATDLTVQHRGVVYELLDGAPRARNWRDPDPGDASLTGIEEVPAATAAALLVAKETFDSVGGYALGYVYGAEDVDLCLRLRSRGPIVVQRDAALFHWESATQAREPEATRGNRERNWRLFAETWGPTLSRSIRKDRLGGGGHWTMQRTRKVAITLTREDPAFGHGDYYTAHELGDAFASLGWDVHYAERHGNAWDEMPADVDLVISLLDSYDVRTAPDGAFTIAWIRNWLDRWLERPWFGEFDLVVTSSHRAASEVTARTGVEPPVLPLATNPDRFTPGAPVRGFESDFAFTGNNWGEPREFVESVDVEENERFGLYGKGWAEVPSLASHWRGFIEYEALPDVYRSSSIVLDDTAGPTIEYGFVNSRVFDALAAGALVVSNNTRGSEELFEGLLPTYSGKAGLRELLSTYLEDDAARSKLQSRLRAIVLEHHTYGQRARQFIDLAMSEIDRPRLAVKIAAPTMRHAQRWGDLYYAQALIKAMRAYGFAGEVHVHPEWDAPNRQAVDLVVQLRGHHVYAPKPSALNVMWLISHPDATDHDEFERFDIVAVASRSMANALRKTASTVVVAFPQATDGDRFGAAIAHPDLATDVLFVGNSRGREREAVRWAIDRQLPLTVYGTQWDGIIPREYVAAPFFPNEDLPHLYASAGVVLNDHWPDMREKGFISNRIFDVLAAGGFVISDPVEGLAELLGDAVPTFSNPDELEAIVRRFRDAPAERQALIDRGRQIVLKRHTFAHRAGELMDLLGPLLKGRALDLDGNELEFGRAGLKDQGM